MKYPGIQPRPTGEKLASNRAVTLR